MKTPTPQTTFTKKQIENWRAFERVRQGGRWNMFFPQARTASGLTEEEYTFTMKNFVKLKEAADQKTKGNQ